MSSTTSRLDQSRAAKNQFLFGAVNERVNEINKPHDLWVTLSDWFCECPARKCTTRIALTPHQYEAVRANPTQFIVAPSREHLVPDVDRVIDRHERYWIVDKVGGAAAVIEQLDPREPAANDAPAP
jgi:hypothetical protein